MATANELNISQPGIMVFDGTATFTGVNLTAGTGITITNGSGLAGNPIISSTASATDLHAPRFIVASSTAGTGANFTTIAAAIAAVQATGVPGTIFLQPGTYTENVTVTNGINITSFTGDSSLNTVSNVTILGKITMTSAGTVNISGIQLKTNSDFFLAVTGSAASVVNLQNCYLNASNNTGISYTSSSGSSAITCFNCYGNVGTTGIAPFAHSAGGSLSLVQCNITNTGSATTAATCSAGVISIFYTNFSSPITTSSTGGFGCYYSTLNTSATNTLTVTIGGSGSSESTHSYFSSGSASCITITSTLSLHAATLLSSNTNSITGVGTLISSELFNANTSAAMSVSTNTLRPSFSGGISFDKGANILNTYSTSTWTPTIVPSGTGFTSITYGTQSGTWTKIGNLVTVQAYVTATAVTVGPATGDINLPLPFSISASAPTVSIGTLRIENVTFANKYVQTAGSSSGTALALQQYTSAGAAANIAASAATNTMGFGFTITYRF